MGDLGSGQSDESASENDPEVATEAAQTEKPVDEDDNPF